MASDSGPAAHSPVAAPPARRVGPGVLVVLGVVLVALNLRTLVTSLGALLPEISEGVGLSPTLAGVVTMLPTLSFAAAGSTAPWLARRLSPPRILVTAMVLLAIGQVARALTDSALVFLGCSALALSGIAVANVLMPALVKQHFPDRVGLLTGVYTMCMIFGNAAAAAASVPIAQVAGSWRVGLGAWALLAVVAALPWLPAAVRRSAGGARLGAGSGTALEVGADPAGTAGAPRSGTGPAGPRVRPVRTRLGWAMGLYFGCQALNGYAFMGWLAQLFRDAGFSPATAGLLLAMVTAVGVPVAFLTPNLATRIRDLRPVVLALSVASTASYVGLMVAPGGPAVLWVTLLAAGQAAFPFALTMIGLRARTSEGTVALSAFTQGTGYLIAGLGPLLVGVLYGATGGWTAPLGFLIGVVVVQAVVGLAIARPRYLEDEVEGRMSGRWRGR